MPIRCWVEAAVLVGRWLRRVFLHWGWQGEGIGSGETYLADGLSMLRFARCVCRGVLVVFGAVVELGCVRCV